MGNLKTFRRLLLTFHTVCVEFGDNLKSTVSCDSSQIIVVLDVPWDDVVRAHIRAKEVSAIVVGALGFSKGYGYSVEITQVTEQEGESRVFGVMPAKTLQIGTDHIPAYQRALQLSARDIVFRRALRDYLRAITDETDCAFYCYRAIEAIKSTFPGKDDKQQWNAMHAALKTDEDTIKNTVQEYAQPVRHGNWIKERPTTSSERWDMQRLTRDILVKYLDYVS